MIIYAVKEYNSGTDAEKALAYYMNPEMALDLVDRLELNKDFWGTKYYLDELEVVE